MLRPTALSAPARGRDCLRVAERGSSLLLVVGATAALGVFATALLSASLLGYRIAALEHQGAQARLLAAAAVAAAGREMASGGLAVPAPGAAVVWRLEVPRWPDAAGAPLPQGCRFEVTVTGAQGPDGAPLYGSSTPPVRIVDAVAEGSCGRGFASRLARFGVDAGGSVARRY